MIDFLEEFVEKLVECGFEPFEYGCECEECHFEFIAIACKNGKLEETAESLAEFIELMGMNIVDVISDDDGVAMQCNYDVINKESIITLFFTGEIETPKLKLVD